MSMVRKQVYIEPEQDEKLKHLAKRLGVTEAELIRGAIERIPEWPARRQPSPATLTALLKERERRLPEGGGTRHWNRDDIYHERLSRISAR